MTIGPSMLRNACVYCKVYEYSSILKVKFYGYFDFIKRPEI